jgi:hypothetical protein
MVLELPKFSKVKCIKQLLKKIRFLFYLKSVKQLIDYIADLKVLLNHHLHSIPAQLYSFIKSKLHCSYKAKPDYLMLIFFIAHYRSEEEDFIQSYQITWGLNYDSLFDGLQMKHLV